MQKIPVSKQDFAEYYALYRVAHEPLWLSTSLRSTNALYEDLAGTAVFFTVDDRVMGGALIEEGWTGMVFVMPYAVASKLWFALLEDALKRTNAKTPLTFYGVSEPHRDYLMQHGFKVIDGEQAMAAHTVMHPPFTWPKGLSLHPVSAADQATLVRLYTEVYQAHTLESIKHRKASYYETLLTDQLKDHEEALSFVIRDGDRTIAAVLVEEWEAYPFLLDLVVLPDWQGQGLGTRMLKTVISRASAFGPYIRLNVTPGNPAIRLYERLGFAAFKPTYTMRLER